jgi:hypothetical protein
MTMLIAPPGTRIPVRHRPGTIALIALDPSRTRKARNLRTGRREWWRAVSADGEWAFDRQEDEGTTWTAVHVRSRRPMAGFPSLRMARNAAATGQLLEALNAASPAPGML